MHDNNTYFISPQLSHGHNKGGVGVGGCPPFFESMKDFFTMAHMCNIQKKISVHKENSQFTTKISSTHFK